MIWLLVILAIISLSGLVWLTFLNKVNLPMPMDENDALLWHNQERPYISDHYTVEVYDKEKSMTYRVPKVHPHAQEVENLCGKLQDARMQVTGELRSDGVVTMTNYT